MPMTTPAQRGKGGRFKRANGTAAEPQSTKAIAPQPTEVPTDSKVVETSAASIDPANQRQDEPASSPPSMNPPPLPPELTPPKRKGRGRPRLTPEEKTKRAAERQAPEWKINHETPAGMPSTEPLASRDKDRQYKETAAMLVGTTLGACVMIGGPEFAPTPEENKFLNDATYEYLKAKGLPDLPPGWVLLGAITLYVGPRLMNPEVQARFMAMFGKRRAPQQ